VQPSTYNEINIASPDKLLSTNKRLYRLQ